MQATSNYNDLYAKHGISPKFRPFFDALANDGVISNAEFSLRLATCENYKACVTDIMHRLSKPYEHLLRGLQPAQYTRSRATQPESQFVPNLELGEFDDELTILPFPESI